MEVNKEINIDRVVANLKGKRVLFITTSTRWSGSDDSPKSSQLAEILAERLKGESVVQIINCADLNIYQCEGNVSTSKGNTCGVKDSNLKDADKNPSGCHRCWASINHKDDELWKISKALFDSDAVIFFGSVRWGSANAVYQKLIERLNWIENRWATLGESNIVSNIDAGVIFTGHNWRVNGVIELQKQVLSLYGFNVIPELSGGWQWTSDMTDETADGYKRDPKDFDLQFGKEIKLNENYQEFINRVK